jgi:hypothetical protein
MQQVADWLEKLVAGGGWSDIVPTLVIAKHPLLTTDKSAFSPPKKITLQFIPGWERRVHDLPPKPAIKRYPLMPDCL